MPRNSAPFKIRMIARPEYLRYVVRDARRLADNFWTGRHWSRNLRDGRLFDDPEDVARTLEALTLRHLRRHGAKRLYTLTVVARVHAEGAVSRHDVEDYIRKALFLGVDHESHGTGPTPGSLVEVVAPMISLEEDL